jgi:NAD(P)-dependent dehydrogenase (short-subunit alcohol dehydrogenase family)
MPTAVITGASRGIGLEFVRQYLADGWTVHAGARDPEGADQLAALACEHLHVHQLDVTNHGHIAALAKSLAGAPVDLLINNAGMWLGEFEAYGRFTNEAWMEEFRVHVLGTMAMCEALKSNVASSDQKLIINISSSNGRLDWDENGTDYPYNTSKAALNMLTKGLSVELVGEGITVVAFTPGFVATDMSGPDADLTPQESIEGMKNVIAGLDATRTGAFLRYNGESLPW